MIELQVVEFMESRQPVDNQPVHIINIDIQDNHEEATMGAFLICDMVSMVSRLTFWRKWENCSLLLIYSLQMASSDDLDNDIDELLHEFEANSQRSLLHCVLFY